MSAYNFTNIFHWILRQLFRKNSDWPIFSPISNSLLQEEIFFFETRDNNYCIFHGRIYRNVLRYKEEGSTKYLKRSLNYQTQRNQKKPQKLYFEHNAITEQSICWNIFSRKYLFFVNVCVDSKTTSDFRNWVSLTLFAMHISSSWLHLATLLTILLFLITNCSLNLFWQVQYILAEDLHYVFNLKGLSVDRQ